MVSISISTLPIPGSSFSLPFSASATQIPLSDSDVHMQESTSCGHLMNLLERIVALICDIFESIKSCFVNSAAPLIPTTVPPIPLIEFTTFASIEPVSQKTIHDIEIESATWQRKLETQSEEKTPLLCHQINLLGEGPTTGFCPPVGMACMPYIGKYGAAYPMAMNILAIRLPKSQLHAFPEKIRNQLTSYPEPRLDLFFIIYNAAGLKQRDQAASSGQPAHLRNIIYHPIVFRDFPANESRIASVAMGIFNPRGLQEIPQAEAGIQFEGYSPKCVYFHPSGRDSGGQVCISPNDARFAMTEDPISTFYSAAALPENRATAVFGVILNESSRESPEVQKVFSALKNNTHLQGFLNSLNEQKLDAAILNPIEEILSFRSPSPGPL